MKFSLIAGVSLLSLGLAAPALADDDARIEALEARVQQLEAMNRQLLDVMQAQGLLPQADAPAAPALAHQPAHDRHGDAPMQIAHHDGGPHGAGHGDHHGDEFHQNLVGISPEYGYRVLDHAEGVNTRPLTILNAARNGELDRRVTLSGDVTALANYQESNSNTKFGWLMRHPTSANQIGETVSEFVIHSAQLAVTGRMTESVTLYSELLYDPEQSFGAGTLTDLNRNQIQLRRAFVLFGDLERTPWYAAIGKMDTPFGLNDTVSPFTNSTNWHAFAGLATGGLVGYYNNGLHVRAMAIQGGAQFRAHNAPVEDTNVPSRVNNFAVDVNYTANLGDERTVMAGASYTEATAYCQAYPVFHFNPCDDNNPGWAVYARADLGRMELLGEYATTTEDWPGTASPVPIYAAFDPVAAESFTLGGRYWFDVTRTEDFALSFEFSRFISGDDGAPWEKQDQWVLGGSYFLSPSVNLFGELIRTEGWVPLNFLSGGNLPTGESWSESDANTNVLVLGVQASF